MLPNLFIFCQSIHSLHLGPLAVFLLFCLDIDECSPNPCENGGNCTDGINDFKCTCRIGFIDKNCSTSKNGNCSVLGQ